MQSKKVNFPNLNTVKPMTVQSLKAMHTGSLLKRLQSLRGLQDSFVVSDWSAKEKKAVEEIGLIAFKKTEVWKEAFSDVKEELSLREHLPRDSKEMRQEAAH